MKPSTTSSADSSTPYKYGEFTEAEFDHHSRYGGTFTYIAELPHGTKFLVNNGNWNGKVLHQGGKTIIQTTWKDNLCANGENQYEIDDRYALWITIREAKV